MRARGRVPRPGQRVSEWRRVPGTGACRAGAHSVPFAPGSGVTALARATRARAARRRCWSARPAPARTTRPASRAWEAFAASAGQVCACMLPGRGCRLWVRRGAVGQGAPGPSGPVCVRDCNLPEPQFPDLQSRESEGVMAVEHLARATCSVILVVVVAAAGLHAHSHPLKATLTHC